MTRRTDTTVTRMKHRPDTRKSSRQTGFTLLELLAVMSVIAILAALAVTSYQSQIRKARRADAKTVLLETAQFLERNYTEANRYDQDSAGNSITNSTLPHPESPVDGGRKYYAIQFQGTPASQTFTIDAIPKNGQEKDTLCATLRIDETGAKAVVGGTGSVGECWSR